MIKYTNQFSKDFKYYGVQYGKECYCGMTLNANAKTKLKECRVACAGDSKLICGGARRISVYKTQCKLHFNCKEWVIRIRGLSVYVNEFF